MDTVTASFNTAVRQMTEMFQWPNISQQKNDRNVSANKKQVHCMCMCDTQLRHFVVVTLLPTGHSRFTSTFSSRPQ